MFKKLIYLASFVLVMSLVLSSVAHAAALPGCIGWWKLDEMSGTTAFDSSGLNNHGTLGPEGNPQWVAGYFGGALDLDGSDDYVEINSVDDDFPSNNNFSFSAWIKTTQTSEGNVLAFNGSGSSHQFQFGISGGNVWLDDGPASTFPPTVVNDNQWHMIACVRDGTTTYIYVDGVQIATDPSDGNPSSDVRISIGQEWDSSPSDEYNGTVDDVHMFNRPLTAEEIKQVMIGKQPGTASNPSPEDEATDVPRDVTLSWIPGEFAPPVNGHKVYLSENFDDVNAGIGGVTQSAASYVPPQRLDFSKTYYWRVDEVNGPPDFTVYEGSVWSFTTEPFTYPIENIIATASSQFSENTGPENTINGSGLDDNDLHSTDEAGMWLSSMAGPQPTWIQYEFDRVYKLYQMWVWNFNQVIESVVGFGFKEVTIEYSTNGTDWAVLADVPEFAQAPGTPGYAHNTTVDLGGVPAKYVKLTANSNFGGLMPQYGLSEVRFLHIPVFAREPAPASGATDADVEAVLSWRAGREAASHKVYLSTDEQAVIDETISPVSIPAGSSYANYNTGPLVLGQSYYWKVNEVNEAETPATWQGDVWSFTAQEYLVVDNFEDYNDFEPDRIFDTWIDGWGVPENGSQVGYAEPPFAEQSIARGGGQSMPLSYDNTTASYSEATANVANLAIGQDWTRYGIKALTLWFYGDPNNPVTEKMYVKLNGSKVVYDGEVGDITKTRWQQWNIDLKAFTGVNLSNVTELSIGLERSGVAGGQGVVYFDDIRLYPTRCVPDIRQPGVDLNDDCVVDYLDLQIMVGDWLKTDSAVSTMVAGPAEIVAHYKLDGNASDSSGNNNHGVEREGPTYIAGKFNQAIHLDGSNDYVAIQNFHYDSASGLTAVTVAAWIRTSLSYNQIIVSFDRNEYWRLQIAGEAGGPGLVGFEVYTDTGQVDTELAANWPANTGRVDDGQWHHVAGVFDNGTLTIYINGIAKEPYSGGATFGRGRYIRYGYLGVGSESTSFDAEPRTPANFFDGDLDEVYIYHRALAPAEIAYLADETPGDGQLYLPVPSIANLYNEESPLARSVNVKDFVLLADGWLDEQLWP